MKKIYKNGLTIGKFMPPHKGHELMIDYGASLCETMFVLCSGREDDEIKLHDRVHALDVHFNYSANAPANVRIISDVDDIPDSKTDEHGTATEDWFWKAWVEKIHKYITEVDAVFTNDPYGERLAKELNADWVPIDPKREVHDICATAIRNNMTKYWDYMMPEAQEIFKKRIVVVGPESTGKSTMVKHLAERYNAGYVPEYGRTVAELNPDLTRDDFRKIIAGHTTMVEHAAKNNRVVMVDTEAYTTYMFSRIYFNLDEQDADDIDFIADMLTQSCYHDRYNLYILLAPTVKWVDDGLRVLPDQKQRETFFHEMKGFLVERGREFIIVDDDNYEDRNKRAIKRIDQLF